MLLRYTHLDLPVWTGSEGCCVDAQELVSASLDTSQTHIVRAVAMNYPPRVCPLNSLLRQVDEHFNLLTERGVPVVPYSWMLIPLKNIAEQLLKSKVRLVVEGDVPRIYQNILLPAGFLLGAEVEIVRINDAIQDNWHSTAKIISDYKQEHSDKQRPFLTDMHVSQTKFGVLASQEACNAEAQRFIVDIEPRFGYF